MPAPLTNLPKQNFAPVSRSRVVDVVQRISSQGFAVTTAGDLVAVHCYTPKGTVVVTGPLVAFAAAARGERDANGRPFAVKVSTLAVLEADAAQARSSAPVPLPVPQASAGDASVWNAASQPDEIVRAALAATQEASGVYGNRGLIGLQAWNFRHAAYAGSDKAGAFASLNKTREQVAGDLMLDDLRVDKALYQSTKTAKARIVGSNFIGFTARDGLSKDDPSNLKQFYTPAGGARWRVFRKASGPADKFIEIIVEHYESIVGTSTVGVTRLNITAAA